MAKRSLNLTTDRRLAIAQSCAIELVELLKPLRQHVVGIGEGGIEAAAHEVASGALLDRLDAMADALFDVATPEDDKAQDAARLCSAFGIRRRASSQETANG